MDRRLAPSVATAEIVCGKWTLLIDPRPRRGPLALLRARALARRASRPRTLSLRLRALEEEGIVERQTFPEVPPRVEYALTEKGRALVPIIDVDAHLRHRVAGRDGRVRRGARAARRRP